MRGGGEQRHGKGTREPFTFWFYVTLAVSLITGFFYSGKFLSSNVVDGDGENSSWFRSLPPALRDHYSDGVFVKAHFSSSSLLPTQVFTVDRGDKSEEPVLLIHGLGSSSFSFRRILANLQSNGFRAVALDLPGSGFSDLIDRDDGGVWKVWRSVKEKGIFWGFDSLISMGYIPYDEDAKSSVSGDELGVKVIEEVIDSLELETPIHFVAHDSAMQVVASYVSSASSGSVGSVTFIDSSSRAPAFPYWMFSAPIVRDIAVGSKWVFGSLINLCCSREIDSSAVEAYRAILKKKGARQAAAVAGKSFNHSFDFGDWTYSDEVKDVPLQILWSHMSSDLWIEEGKRVASSAPRAAFFSHLGGRWPQVIKLIDT